MSRARVYLEPSAEVKSILAADALELRTFVEHPDPVRTRILALADEICLPYFEALLANENSVLREIGDTQLREAMTQSLRLADFLAASIELFIDARKDTKPYERQRYLAGVILSPEEFRRAAHVDFSSLSKQEQDAFHVSQCGQFVELQVKGQLLTCIDKSLGEEQPTEGYYYPLYNRPQLVGTMLVQMLSTELMIKSLCKIRGFSEDDTKEVIGKMRKTIIGRVLKPLEDDMGQITGLAPSPILPTRAGTPLPGLSALMVMRPRPGKMH